MVKCPSCGRENADAFNFCLDCGYDLKAWRDAMSGSTPTSLSPAVATEPMNARDSKEAMAAAAAMPPQSSGARAAYQPGPSPLAPTPLSAPPAGPTPSNPSTMVVESMPPAPGPGAPAPYVSAHGAAPPSTASSTPYVPQGVPGNGGLAVAVAQTACAKCGARQPATMKFCGNCGNRLDVADTAPAQAAVGAARTMFMHAAEAQAAVREHICKLVTIDQSGREGMTFTLKGGETRCGRVNGIVLFTDDPYVSPTHCLFRFKDGVLHVVDQRSLNGVYVRVRGERRLTDGDTLRIGRQLYRFEHLSQATVQVARQDGDDSRIWGSPDPTAFGRLVQVLEDGRTGEIRVLGGERVQLGREQGEIVVPTDGFVSGRHCAFLKKGDEAWIADLGSSNGTYLRIRGEADVATGDFLLVGNQMLRVEIA